MRKTLLVRNKTRLGLLRICLLLAFVLLTCKAMAQIALGGRQPFNDRTTGSLLFVVPDSCLQDLYADVVRTDLHWTDLTLDGKVIAQEMRLGDVSRGKTVLLKGKYDGRDSALAVHFTSLPVIEVKKNSAFTDDYTPCSIILETPDGGSQTIESAALIKHRGGTTNAPDRHKRNYHFKLVDAQGKSLDMPLLGMREDNSWLLDAGQIDLFRMRNHINHELWLDFSSSPYYHNSEPNSVNGCHVRLVELFVNDEYRGLYSLMEPIDRKQLKLKKYKKGVRGALWKAFSWDHVPFNTAISNYDNTSATCYGFEAKYPEPGDDADTTDYMPLVDAVNFVAGSTDDDFRLHINEYIDMPVFKDYVIFINLINGIDNVAKNCYWSVYDETKDRKITITPWDLDATYGQDWANDIGYQAYCEPNNDLQYITNIDQRSNKLLGEAYTRDLCERYAALRETLFAEDSLVGRFQKHFDTIDFCGALVRETQKWSRDTDLGGKELDFANELNAIKTWLHKRLEYLDKKYNYAPTGIRQISDQTFHNNWWYTLQGIKISHPTSGIYIHNGKKVWIRPDD